MSIKLMTAVWETSIGPATRRLILLALADIANDEGEAWPRIETLSRRANCSRTTAEDSLRSLAADGIIQRESRGFNRSNMYRINLPMTPGFRGSLPMTPETAGDDPRIPGGGTPENPGTEPSVEPPEEPTPSVNACASTTTEDQLTLLDEPPAPSKARKTSHDTDASFARFWQVYPRRVAKQAARRAFDLAVKSVPPDVIISGAARYAVEQADPTRSPYTKHPATWLRGGCWDDEPASPVVMGRNGARAAIPAHWAAFEGSSTPPPDWVPERDPYVGVASSLLPEWHWRLRREQ